MQFLYWIGKIVNPKVLVEDGHWRPYKGMSLAYWFKHLGSGKFTKILQNSDCFTCLQIKDKKVENFMNNVMA